MDEEVGLKKLSASSKVANVARAHSKDMAAKNYFSHNSLDDKSPFDRIKNAGIIYSWAGENIAAGYASPAAVVNGWKNSQGHYENMINASFTKLGVGYSSLGNSRDIEITLSSKITNILAWDMRTVVTVHMAHILHRISIR